MCTFPDFCFKFLFLAYKYFISVCRDPVVMVLAWAAHHWKYCFREQRSLVTFAYNCAHIVPRNLVNRVVGAHFSFIVLKQRNHEVKLPLDRPHCPAMAGRRCAAEPAGVVPNPAPRWQAQKWSDPSRYV